MLGTTFLLPLYFQFMRGADASSSGILLMPFLMAFVVLSYAGGKFARRIGKTKWLMVIASLVTALGLALMATAEENTSRYLTTIYVVVIGGGIGLIQPCVTMTVQNAVELRDLGIATSGTLLFRMIGGAFGATLVGAIVTGEFNARMDALARLLMLHWDRFAPVPAHLPPKSQGSRVTWWRAPSAVASISPS